MEQRTMLDEALKLSHKMLELAEAQSWEMLAATERQRNTLLSRPTSPLNEQEAAIIRQILASDEAVMGFVLPWMQATGNLLGQLDTAGKPGNTPNIDGEAG